MLVKVELRLVPTAVSAPMITTAIRAAISPYSIAVAPLSLRKKVEIAFCTLGLQNWWILVAKILGEKN